jgi:hypothetical protein
MNIYLRLAIGVILGGGLGFAYYYFVGCSTGSCPITSNWHLTTVYGAAVGLAMAYPSKKKGKDNDSEKSENK